MSCGIPCPCPRLQASPTDSAVTPGPSAMLRAIAGALASPNRSPILSDSSSLGIPLARSQRLLSWCAVNHDLAWNRRSCAANLDYSYSPSASSGGLLHRRPVIPMHRDSGAPRVRRCPPLRRRGFAASQIGAPRSRADNSRQGSALLRNAPAAHSGAAAPRSGIARSAITPPCIRSELVMNNPGKPPSPKATKAAGLCRTSGRG